ncbi:MAG: cation-translocating P-type ATPase [Pirellulaceae bacterium]
METLLNAPDKPWTRSAGEMLDHLRVAADQGLDEAEVKARREQFGPNRLQRVSRKSAWRILVDQFRSLIVLLLAAAAALSFASGHWLEGVAITAVLALNGAIGFVTELMAVRSMEALHEWSDVTATVRRGGKVQKVPAHDLVPGDMVIIEGGDIVTADVRLVTGSRLQADESALTGESVPVEKGVDAVEAESPLAERSCMLFKGTAVTRGSGEAVVVATGMKTELGRISSLVTEAEEEQTPLEIRLERLGRSLVWLTLIIAAVIAMAGVIAGRPLFFMVQTAIALAVAAIPEGLPIVATAALARGMWRMARRNGLINRLSAVETLGSTTVICTDKTGTLTENRMTARRFVLESGEIEVSGEDKGGARFLLNGQPTEPSGDAGLLRALQVGVLCNNASLGEDAEQKGLGVGDPMELALLYVGKKAGLRQEEMRREAPEQRKEAFDSETKMMATFHHQQDRYRVAVKGAPEAVLPVCSSVLAAEDARPLDEPNRERWLHRSQELASQGLRVLALAEKTVEAPDAPPYEQLTFLALVGLVDPPRQDVRAAIGHCREAGIRVVMITGDQAATARYVAAAVGLTTNGEEARVLEGKDLKEPDQWTDEDRNHLRSAAILARVDPKQKLDLVALYQEGREVVAMTGDGVNDAPALKKADIGIAMGLRGTQVAREAADMVLKDDAFATIVAAVEQGRIIFTNIRKFVVYLMSCNVSEILVVALVSLINAPMPILPLQILFLNLVTDVFPALALGAGEGDPHYMQRPPRDPREPVLTRRHWWAIGGYGLLIACAVLTAFALALTWLEMPTEQAVTVSFLTLAFAQLWHVFNLRDAGSGFVRNDITRNPFVWGAVVLCIGLLLAAVYVPGLGKVLQVVEPGRTGWLLLLGMSFVPWIVGQLLKGVGVPFSLPPQAASRAASSSRK